jgi:hypothetical protein
MPKLAEPKVGVGRAFREWWKVQRERAGLAAAGQILIRESWQFLRDSTPARRRSRYGDVDYDWDHRVDTTSATVGWRNRLLGALYSPYQPTDPALFQEMMDGLEIEYSGFTFIDLGSGKGRALLMASDYPFRRILGVELLPELHRAAEENIRNYRNPAQQCFALKSVCQDAREFEFPPEPTVLYLFNPLPEDGLRQAVAKLEQSMHALERPVYVLYHNPVLESVVAQSEVLRKIGGTHQYSVFSNDGDKKAARVVI